MHNLFEKVSIIFLIIVLVLLIVFLTFYPVNSDSKDVILIIIGTLTGIVSSSTSKLFTNNHKVNELTNKVKSLEISLKEEQIKYETIDNTYHKIIEKMVLKK